ncbi:MAG TPA: hypothetical protein VF297_06930 [Pyrinomonadaceae bacterium]
MIFESDIGFVDRSAVALLNLVRQVCEHGEVIETAAMKYVKWSVGEGLELWLRFKDGEPELLPYPGFAGGSRMKVALLEKTPRQEPLRGDGAFYCRGRACAGANWVAGRNPFVFDTHNYHAHDGLSLPRVCTIQLTAFAFNMTGYPTEEDFEEAYPGDEQGFCWDYKHFIPLCMTAPRHEGGELQEASAEVSGYVTDTAIITNPVTGHDFCWARLETIGGEVDVVCSPDRLSGYLVKGGLAATTCYLYGRLIDDDSN